jgi:RNA polymerase sigma-54 factor
MKQTIQLRLGQHLTMTPQLQQAIRLLQLSTLDLKTEIQDALDSNLMLETEEEGRLREQTGGGDQGEPLARGAEESDGAGEPPRDNRAEDRELDPEHSRLDQELPVDSDWSDIYDSYALPQGGIQRDDGESDFLAQKTRPETLHDHLMWQLNLTPFSPTDNAIATAIIDAVNEDGYLTGELQEILAAVNDPEVDLAEVEAVLHRVQAFDPPGVAARDLRECLLLQLRQLPPDTPFRRQALEICGDHFSVLAGQDYVQLKRRLGLEDSDLQSVIRLLRSLHPRPGTTVAEAEPQYVTPDVFVSRRNGTWHVELNPDATPRLRVNPDYAKLIRRADQSDDNACLRNHLQEARWFLKSLTSRNETVLRVATKIVELQRAFFDHGEEAMKPLVLRDVAEALEMHESTVSRVTTQKYMYTPRGTFEFKYFFSSHVGTSTGGECSATAIRALLKKLIAAEKPNKPLSDNKLAQILGEQGINVARRTVAKYRESMGIPPSNERKRLL